MQNDSFYDEPTEQSQVKARIVEKYFWAWAKVIIPVAKESKNRIGYVDFFAGPGRYEDGTESTPILVLKKAVEDDDIRNMLISVFNDADPKYAQNLQDTIDSTPEISNLKRKPIVKNVEVGAEIAQALEPVRTIPTLFFVDPWGYKDLSVQLIGSLLENWGCDCIFFFNYNRINMGINNEAVDKPIDALFGKELADELRNLPPSMESSDRELFIIEAISQSLKKKAGQYVLPFCFKSPSGKRSIHHLIFVSKHRRGYQIMKDIMAGESTDSEQGVASFGYNPATHRQPLLFEYARPLDDLADMLMATFAGQTVTMKQIYEQHNVGTRYISRNYKDILLKLEDDGKIHADPPANERRKNTFGNTVKVTFPSQPE